MNANATPGTPPEIASSITRAWVAYFLVYTVIAIVLNLVLGAVFQFIATSLAGNPYVMRAVFILMSVAVNAPVSFLAFQWAVRGKVLPAVIVWNLGGPQA